MQPTALIPSRFFPRSWWTCLGFALLLTPVSRAQDAEFFERRIRPLFVDQCYKCHSAKADKIKGGLVLDTKTGFNKGGDNGPIIVRGQPDKSRLIIAIRCSDPDLQIPPNHKLIPTPPPHLPPRLTLYPHTP